MWRGGSEAGESDLGGEVVEQLERDEQQLCAVRRLLVTRRGGRRLQYIQNKSTVGAAGVSARKERRGLSITFAGSIDRG